MPPLTATMIQLSHWLPYCLSVSPVAWVNEIPLPWIWPGAWVTHHQPGIWLYLRYLGRVATHYIEAYRSNQLYQSPNTLKSHLVSVPDTMTPFGSYCFPAFQETRQGTNRAKTRRKTTLHPCKNNNLQTPCFLLFFDRKTRQKQGKNKATFRHFCPSGGNLPHS